jgi:ribokinase
MANILISGLVNTETSVRVRQFPVEYYPIDYPFFGVTTAVSGVAYNLALALKTLEDEVTLVSMTGEDYAAGYIREELTSQGISTAGIRSNLRQTPASVVLYDETGRRQVYCDLKDIQEAVYDFRGDLLKDADLVIACNTNFNRPLLALAKEEGKLIATDVHVLRDIYDDYNREFLEAADIVFLSDEGIEGDYRGFLWDLNRAYAPEILVLGRGSKGAAMYVKAEDRFYELPAVRVGNVVNTVGAGDALFSSFLHWYLKGLQPEECLKRAQYFAAAKIRCSGASRGFVTETELERLMEHG